MPNTGATEEQMREMEHCMVELETMVKDVEAVSSILEFNSGSLGSSSKGTFTASSKAAALLAQEVGSDLKRWRRQREEDYVRVSREHANRLKQAVMTRKKQEHDRGGVRQVVRARLFDIAEETMQDKVSDLYMKPIEQNPKVHSDELGRGAFALGALRKRIEVIVSPVEALRPDPPRELQATSDLAKNALERKRMRVQVQQSSLPGMASTLDADLLDVAERNLAERKDAIVEQFERQATALSSIKESLNERSQAFEELAAIQRSGPPPTPQEHWRALWPREDDFSGDQTMALPPRSTNLEGNDMNDLQARLLQKGIARADELCAEFQRKHLRQEKTSNQAMDVQGELDVWKLKVKQALLDEMRESINDAHKDIVGALRSSLLVSSEGPLEQMGAAVAVGEDFNRHRNEALSDVINSAEAKLLNIFKDDRETFGAWRRRAELCALKRWTDIPNGVDDARYRAQATALSQLGEIAQRLVNDCHVALPLPREELKGPNKQLQNPAVQNLFAAWERYNAPVSERLVAAERVVNGLSDAVESCAVAKAALCVIDEEMLRIIKRARENPAPMTGIGKEKREERVRALAAAR